ncbi:unnamed protein product [Ophioblennius macclurei]
MSISSALSSLSSAFRIRLLTKYSVLRILLVLFVGLFFIRTFSRKYPQNSLAQMLYPHPVKHFMDSLDVGGNADKNGPRTELFWKNINTGESCSPKAHIAFLKTHRTESATIQNILYRYGEKSGLTFALPESGNLGFSFPTPFQAQFVEGVRDRSVENFDIMCNEMRFQKSEVAKVMPEDTFYFSMLRRPELMTQSMFTYFKFVSSSREFHTLDQVMLDQFGRHLPSDTDEDFLSTNLALDFGFNNSVTASQVEQRAAEVIADMERDFHLLLINEYFDESLVLLRHALCWSLEDVATFRRTSHGDQTAVPFLAATVEHVQRWNALDWKIYQHFNATFWRRVESVMGAEQMKTEVSELRELQARLTQICLKARFKRIPKAFNGIRLDWTGGDVSLGFNIDQQLDNATYRRCQKHLTPEVQYTFNLFQQQFANPKRRREEASTGGRESPLFTQSFF